MHGEVIRFTKVQSGNGVICFVDGCVAVVEGVEASG